MTKEVLHDIHHTPEQQLNIMKAMQLLRSLGQRLWLDNITRDLLNSCTLNRYGALVLDSHVGVNL
jgi:hypothetical protein